MIETIKQSEHLSEAESARLFGWSDDIFGASGWTIANRAAQLHFILEFDGLAVSHLNLVKAEVAVGAQQLSVAGIGGVVTRGDAQGKGCARKLLRLAAEFFEREWQVDAGMLFCFERLVPYYASQGWQLIKFPVIIDQPTGRIEYPSSAMVLPCAEKTWPEGTVEVDGFPW